MPSKIFFACTPAPTAIAIAPYNSSFFFFVTIVPRLSSVTLLVDAGFRQKHQHLYASRDVSLTSIVSARCELSRVYDFHPPALMCFTSLFSRFVQSSPLIFLHVEVWANVDMRAASGSVGGGVIEIASIPRQCMEQ
jgi:hypothetical protein